MSGHNRYQSKIVRPRGCRETGCTAPFARRAGRLPGLAVAILIAVSPLSAWAQGRGLEVNPRRPTFTDDAYPIPIGSLQVESGYSALLFEGALPTLHVWDVYAALGVADLLEVRLGWDLVNAAGGESGAGDLTLGVKGGFFGGVAEGTALAGILALELPTGSPFGLGEGVRFEGGLVASQPFGQLEVSFQATLDTHIFRDDPTLFVPLSIALVWAPVAPLRVYTDTVIRLDLTDFSETQNSLLGGAGYRILSNLELNTGVRLGLSTSLPDVVFEIGAAWQFGPLW